MAQLMMISDHLRPTPAASGAPVHGTSCSMEFIHHMMLARRCLLARQVHGITTVIGISGSFSNPARAAHSPSAPTGSSVSDYSHVGLAAVGLAAAAYYRLWPPRRRLRLLLPIPWCCTGSRLWSLLLHQWENMLLRLALLLLYAEHWTFGLLSAAIYNLY